MQTPQDTLAAEGEPSRAATAFERGDPVGRYVLLSQLGAGGMGVVYAAYDPELDRKVAVKLLHHDGAGGRHSEGHTRLLREAQAMAKLSHPNVITVHDVGVVDGRVYVAMEFVEGETLRSWLEGERTWREVLELFIAAGRGLAAAHEQGLVHRDFKPDNVLVDASGRAFVVDFGLARGVGKETPRQLAPSTDAIATELTIRGSLLGTPAYMAPEQHHQRDVDARTDQFSFCVALWEGLYGERPFDGETVAAIALNVTEGKLRAPPGTRKVPSWLRAVVERGLAVEPRARFESLAELLEAASLGTTRQRVRLGMIGVALVVLAGAGTLGGLALDREQRSKQCRSEAGSIAEVWNADRSAGLRDAFVASGLSYAATSVAHVAPLVDVYTQTWEQHYGRLCAETVVDETRSHKLWAASRACLRERKVRLAALLEVFTTDLNATGIQRSVSAALALGRIELCADDSWLARNPLSDGEDTADLRRRMFHAAALQRTGRYQAGLALAPGLLEDSKATDNPRLHIQALRLAGKLHQSVAAYDAAERVLRQSFALALEHEEDDAALDTATQMTRLMGDVLARHAEGMWWGRVAEAIASRLGVDQELAGADVQTSLAAVYRAQGNLAEAEQADDRALEIREQLLGADHLSVAGSLNALSIVYYAQGRFEGAERAQARALEIREQALGPDHPTVGDSLNNLANLYHQLQRYEDAERAHTRALSVRERALGANHPKVADSHSNLGAIYRKTGRDDLAEQSFLHAIAIRERTVGPDHPVTLKLLVNLAVVYRAQGRHDQAERALTRALAGLEHALGPDHIDLALALRSLGEQLLDQGRHDESERAYTRAIAIQEHAIGLNDPRLPVPLLMRAEARLALGRAKLAVSDCERALAIQENNDVAPTLRAHAKFMLARALWDAKANRQRARTLAEQARDIYSEAGDATPAHRDVKRWLAGHRL